MSVGDALLRVLADVARAAADAGRDPASVRLLAVSKGHGADAIRAAFDAGQRDFGENYLQELEQKAAALADLPIGWHFIGRPQGNKLRRIAARAAWVHAVDSVDHAAALGRARAGAPPLPVLLAVNVGGESSKGGIEPSDALAIAERVAAADGVTLRGLMALPPFHDDPEASRPHFEALAALAAEGRARGLPLDELSMGMSHDFPVAVACGATWVRVGTSIFGARG